jgi:hypothetical protein
VHDLPAQVSTPRLRRQVEDTLVAQAKAFDPPTLQRLGHHVLANVDPDLADRVLAKKLQHEEARAERDRYLRLGWDHTSGTWRLAARLPKLLGEQLKLALDPLAAPQTGPAGHDKRLPEQRSCDAFGEMVRRVLADHLVPSHGGNPTQLVVTITPSGAGRTLHSGIDLSPSIVEQLRCEADRAYLTAPEHQPGNLSLVTDDQQRLFQRKPRRLLELRDRGCAFPGCDRPPGWCHAHHVTTWSKGGATTLANGVLLCGYHHRLIHHGGWQVQIARDGLPEFIPPDWTDPHRKPIRNTRHTPAA